MKKKQKVGQNTKQTTNQTENQGMWDLLLPVLMIIMVLPWIIHLAVYSCGYADYDWYAMDDSLADFYCYYKSYFLDIIGFFAAIVLAFRMSLYKEKNKAMKVYIPLVIYGFSVILSTIFSMNSQASIQGNFESFESCFVLLSYIILSVYAYQIMEYERDYKIIWYALLGISIAFSVIGLLQVFGYDFMDFQWVQKLIMSKDAFEMYGGELEDTFSKGRVYLTLYNPNYAAIVLAMLFTVVFIMCLTERTKRKKAGYGMLAAVLLVLIWYTYSRASLLAVVAVLCYVVYLQCKSDRMKITGKWMAAAGFSIVLIIGIFVALDSQADFKYLSRIVEENNREPLENLTTEKDGIHITYSGNEYLLWLDGEMLFYKNENTEEIVNALKGEEMALTMEEGAKAIYMDGEEPVIMMYLADTTLHFVKQDNDYFYQTVAGKITKMTEVPAADFHGLEYLGSARGYIWSRVLPLLKDYIFIGSGPDTFAEVFPQHDYAGKIVYSDQPDMVMEKAHNDYLTKWVQTGMISVICIVAFYFALFWQGKAVFKKKEKIESMQCRIGYGCYFACLVYIIASLANDSTLQTAPLFWVFAGIAFSCIKNSKNASKPSTMSS